MRFAAGENVRSKLKAVSPCPARHTGLGMARAQRAGGPRRARSLEIGTPAARLTMFNGLSISICCRSPSLNPGALR